MDGPLDVDSQDGLISLLTSMQVPQALQQVLTSTQASQALQTSHTHIKTARIADFAYAYQDGEDLNSFVGKQTQEFWEGMQVADPEHSPAVARLRRALDRCKHYACSPTSQQSPSPNAPALNAPASNVWAEHAPPRLDAEAVQRMQTAFRSNYPGEHLDADAMPSIRLLSLVHQWFTAKGAIKWIPWQLRMSQKQYQDIIEARATLTLRTVAQLVSSALFDETPEVSIDRAHLSPAWLARTQQIFRNAIALCNVAHLATLKAFDKKILDICTQTLTADAGLGTVNTHELLQADRKIWNEIASLHSEGWSLGEALHEMTCVRADVRALLQPRAKPPVSRDSKGKGKGGKGNGKKGGGKVQTRLKDDNKVSALTEAMRNLQLKHGNKTLCLRFTTVPSAMIAIASSRISAQFASPTGRHAGNVTPHPRIASRTPTGQISKSLPHPRPPPDKLQRP